MRVKWISIDEDGCPSIVLTCEDMGEYLFLTSALQNGMQCVNREKYQNERDELRYDYKFTTQPWKMGHEVQSSK